VKTIAYLIEKVTYVVLLIILFIFFSVIARGQVTTVCTNPTNFAYGLTGNGEIYEINAINGNTVKVIKNNTYAGNSPSNANGLGYNTFNGKFYYFKRNVMSAPQEFVSFNPATNTVTALAASTCTDDIHTGCVSYNGSGFYTIDIQGTMHYYDIVHNKWTFITSNIVDQFNNSVTNIIKAQNAGDLAIDGLGNLWLLTSSATNYGLYKFLANLPTTAVAKITVLRVINPTAVTPTGNSFAGIAFKPNGQVVMATKNDNKLYLLQASNTLSFLGNLATSDVGNDLTSCAFPTSVLPINWKSFSATLKRDNMVELNWEVIEYQSKGYYLQRSTNGTDWDDIAFVAAKNNPETIAEYTYTDINNAGGRQYYRIKQTEANGEIGYSEIVSVVLKNDKKGINIWPNPAKDQVRIAGNGGNESFTKAQIFDLSGRMFTEISLQGNKQTINVSKLPAGTYLIKIQTENGIGYSQKLVKQ